MNTLVRLASILALLGCTLPAAAHAQRIPAAPGDTLRVWQSFWSATGFKYQFGKTKDDAGLGGYRVKLVVADNPAALLEAKRFGRAEAPTFVSSLAAGAAISVGVGANRPGVAWAGLGVLLASYVIDQMGYAHLKKAARLFNADRAPD